MRSSFRRDCCRQTRRCSRACLVGDNDLPSVWELTMKRIFAALKFGSVLAVGIFVGIAWQSQIVDGPSALAQDQKPAASAEEQIRKLKIELPTVSKPTNTL